MALTYTLLDYAGDFRAFKAQIAARYSGITLEQPKFTVGVDNVTAEFLAWLQNPMEFFVHVSPLAQPPRAGIMAASVKAIMDGGGASSGGGLAEENTSLKTENAALRQKLESVKTEIEALDLDGAVRSRIMAAIALDQALEGEAK